MKKTEFSAQYIIDWERISFRDESTIVAFSKGIIGFDDYMITYTFS